MLEEVLDSINNWFATYVESGEWVVSNGSLPEIGLKDGQYFRIVGSTFNDGLHKHPASDLTDEEFDGEVWFLAVPNAVVRTAEEISDWCAKQEPSAMQSESYGGYSYSRMADADGSPMGWQGVFRSRLNRWRKL